MLRATSGGVGTSKRGVPSTFTRVRDSSYFLDFTKETLTPVIGTTAPTVTRALNTATRVNSSGLIEVVNANLPRFDYDPVTLACKGLLIEEARTNIVLYSNDFTNAAWLKSGVPTPTSNVAMAPDGTVTADKTVATAVSAQHYIEQTFTVADSTVFSVSCFVKKADYDYVRISAFAKNGAGPAGEFRFSTELFTYTIQGTGQAGITFTATKFGNGWYRLDIAGINSLTGATVPRLRMYLENNVAATTFTGDGASGTYMWGGQAEVGTFATSYIPTTTASVTRNADVYNLATADIPSFSATAGTLMGEIKPNTPAANGANQYLFGFSDGTDNNRQILFRVNTGGVIGCRLVSATVATNPTDMTSVAENEVAKVALAWAVGASQGIAAKNGALTGASSPASIGAVNKLRLGCQPDGAGAFLNGYIRSVAYWPTRLSNTRLQQLTY